MGTYFPGRIEIGGKLPRSLLPEFVKLLNASGARFDWAEQDDLTEEMILQEVKDNEPSLTLMDGEASFGHFEDLENWLAKHKMSYIVTSDSYCEYEGCIGGIVNGEIFSVEANQSGDAVIGMEVVVSALTTLKDGDIFATIATLSAAAKTVPALPKFEIVDDEPKTKRKPRPKKREKKS